MTWFERDWLQGRWAWLISWFGIVGALALLVALLHLAGASPWDDVTQQRIVDYQGEQCERVNASSFLLQFSNFWSNFAYLASGLLLMCRSSTRIGQIVGASFVFLAFGSAWFHGTLTGLGQSVDIAGVYAALLGLIGYASAEFFDLEDAWPAWTLLGGLLVLGVLAGFARKEWILFDSDVFTPLLVGVILIAMIATGVRWQIRNARPPSRAAVLPSLIGVSAAGVLALIFKFTDGTHNLWAKHDGNYTECLYGPDSLLQGHAVWHLLSAFMFLCMFEFLRLLRQRPRSVLPWLD